MERQRLFVVVIMLQLQISFARVFDKNSSRTLILILLLSYHICRVSRLFSWLFQFATMVRLPDDMPREEKLRRLQETVDALELNKCLNTSER